MVVMTLVSIPLMDRLGRKTLHLGGLSGMFVLSIVFTIAFHQTTQVSVDTRTVAVLQQMLVLAIFVWLNQAACLFLMFIIVLPGHSYYSG